MTEQRKAYIKRWKQKNRQRVNECARQGSVRRRVKHPLIGSWFGMKSRCESKAHRQYASYGGRGIKICDCWQCFSNFERDMALTHSPGLELHRIDNDGDYAVDNCVWITRKEHVKYRKTTKLTMRKAETIRTLYATKQYTQSNLAEMFEVSVSAIKGIIQRRRWVA